MSLVVIPLKRVMETAKHCEIHPIQKRCFVAGFFVYFFSSCDADTGQPCFSADVFFPYNPQQHASNIS